MKNHLIERTISAVWLGILSFLFFYSGKYFSTDIKLNFIYLSMIISLFYILYGFFYRYKVLFFSVDNLYKFPTRCVAIIWGGFLGSCIIWYVLPLIYPEQRINLYSWGTSIFLGSVLGGIFLYKLFLLPKVNYAKLSPSFSQRIISSIWFGTVGGFLSLTINEAPAMSFFAFILAMYFGFTYGSNIFLLPSSLKGILKSAVIGMVVSAYALLIVMLFFISQAVADTMLGQFSAQDFVTSSFAVMFILFPALSLVICSIVTVCSALFYFISRIGNRGHA